ncbi:MAG: hypothetical protein ABSD71_07645 [Bacteroidales bacterium]|jgi:hypothetical protein
MLRNEIQEIMDNQVTIFPSHQSLNTSGFAQGIYFIKLSATAGTLFRKIAILR